LRALLARPALYDALQALLGAERGRAHFVASFVRPQPGDRVLDVGCGTARILDHLPAGAQYWGYDISEPYIDAARERYGARGKFFCRPLDERELAGLPKFDIVLATGVLHHLDDAAASGFLRLARSALADGGRFQRLLDGLLQLHLYVGRHTLRSKYAKPELEIDVGVLNAGLRHCRHVRQRRGAFLAGDGKGLDPLVLN